MKVQCKLCDTVLDSKDSEHHVMMSCKCGEVMADFEEHYYRLIGAPNDIRIIDYGEYN